jgi:hypothetical protein
MRGFQAIVASGLIVLSATGTVSAQGSRLYKWVDERGNVHFSDRVDTTAGEVARLNANGIRIDQPHSAVPRNAEDRRRMAEDRRVAQLDTMLLATYGSEMDLLRAHDASRASMESSIRATESNIARLRRSLQDHQAQADANTPGHSVPDTITDDLRDRIAAEEARLQEMRVRQYEMYEQQNREVARYRELHTRNS